MFYSVRIRVFSLVRMVKQGVRDEEQWEEKQAKKKLKLRREYGVKYYDARKEHAGKILKKTPRLQRAYFRHERGYDTTDREREALRKVLNHESYQTTLHLVAQRQALAEQYPRHDNKTRLLLFHNHQG